MTQLDFYAQLSEAIDSPGADEDTSAALQRAIAVLNAEPEAKVSAAQVAHVLGQLLARTAVDALGQRRAKQKAQYRALFLQQVLETQAALQSNNRLYGDAQSLNRALASVLAEVPKRGQHKVFNASEYLKANPDVAATGQDGLLHYIQGGAAEGRAPMDLQRFAPQSYEAQNRYLPQTLVALMGRTDPLFADMIRDLIRTEALQKVADMAPKISVIMPSWNRLHTIRAAIDSALLQSIPPSEVIVADDGSTDGTISSLKEVYADQIADGRLVLVSLEHQGVSAARNAALARAGGDVIAYLDSDNMWEADHLLYACLGLAIHRKAQSAYTALCRHNLADGWSDVLFQSFDRAALESENYIDLNSFVHRRALSDKLGGFDTALTRLVDWDLILRYTAKSAPVAVPVITGHYFVDKTALHNISTVEDAAPNIARIQAKLRGTA